MAATQHNPSGRGGFILYDQYLPGLLDLLQSTFYPHWTYEKASTLTTIPLVSSSSTHKKRPIKVLRSAQWKGLRRGTRVDKELTQITQLCNQYHHLRLSHFLQPVKKKSLSLIEEKSIHGQLDASDQKIFLKLRRSMHMHTRILIRTLYDLSLIPIASQFPVGLLSLYVGTSVDLICINPNHREQGVYILEIKSGYETYYEAHSGYMLKSPFQQKSDCPHHQHQLQLAMTTWLYRAEMYRQKGTWPKIAGAYVIQVRNNEDRPLIWPNESWIDIHSLDIQKLVFDKLSLIKKNKQI